MHRRKTSYNYRCEQCICYRSKLGYLCRNASNSKGVCNSILCLRHSVCVNTTIALAKGALFNSLLPTQNKHWISYSVHSVWSSLLSSSLKVWNATTLGLPTRAQSPIHFRLWLGAAIFGRYVMATITAVGVAKPSVHGQAIIITANENNMTKKVQSPSEP